MVSQELTQQMDPSFNVISPILMVILFFLALIVIWKSKLSPRIANSLFILSFIGVGVLLGGRPNPVNAINQMFINLNPSTSMSVRLFLSSLGVLTIMLVSVIFFSRIFCGYVCPLGSMQELASKISFKSSLKEQKKAKFRVDPPENILRSIR